MQVWAESRTSGEGMCKLGRGPFHKKRDFAARAGTSLTNHIINNTKTNNQ